MTDHQGQSQSSLEQSEAEFEGGFHERIPPTPVNKFSKMRMAKEQQMQILESITKMRIISISSSRNTRLQTGKRLQIPIYDK